jgi:IS5 family transposase
MLGDTAYDSASLREELDEHGTKPVIPNRCNRRQPFTFNKRLYKLRWRIESAFNRLKDSDASQLATIGSREITSPPSALPPFLYGGFNESGP